MVDEDSYEDLLDRFQRLVVAASAVSYNSAGIFTKDNRVFAASQLFTGLVNRMVSFLVLLPKSRFHPAADGFWDPSSLAAQARTVMETSHSFYYLAIEDVPIEESQARFRLVELHYLTEYCKMMASFEIDINDFPDETGRIDELIQELQQNTYFARLPEKRQRQYLKGKEAFFAKNQELAAQFGLDKETYRAVYKWLSNHAHNHPFAFIKISEDRGRGLENKVDRDYACSLIDMCGTYLARALEMYFVHFPHLRKHLPDDVFEATAPWRHDD